MKNINITAQPDQATVVIEMPDPSLSLNATDIENFIAALATARRNIKPEPAAQPPARQQVLATANPHFTVQNDELANGVNVGLRDLGTGWQWYHFAPDHLQAFIEALQKHQDIAKEAGVKRTLN
jgi:hypothetical protein